MSPGKDIGGILANGYSYFPSRASSKVDLKISAIILRAENLLSYRGEMGEAGCGDRRDAIKSRAAEMAKYVDKDIGVLPLVGNHTTVLAMSSPRISAM